MCVFRDCPERRSGLRLCLHLRLYSVPDRQFGYAFGCAFACIPCRTVSTSDISCKLDSHRIGRYGQVALSHEPDDPGLCRETVQHGIRQRPSVLVSVQVDYLNTAPAIFPGASAEQCCCGPLRLFSPVHPPSSAVAVMSSAAAANMCLFIISSCLKNSVCKNNKSFAFVSATAANPGIRCRCGGPVLLQPSSRRL